MARIDELRTRVSQIEQGISQEQTAREQLIEANRADIAAFTGGTRQRSQRIRQQKRAEEIALNKIRVLREQLTKTKEQLRKESVAQTQGRTVGEITLQERTAVARERAVRARQERLAAQERISIQEFRERQREAFVLSGRSRQATQEQIQAAGVSSIRKGTARTAQGRPFGFVPQTGIAFAVAGTPETPREELITRREEPTPTVATPTLSGFERITTPREEPLVNTLSLQAVERITTTEIPRPTTPTGYAEFTGTAGRSFTPTQRGLILGATAFAAPLVLPIAAGGTISAGLIATQLVTEVGREVSLEISQRAGLRELGVSKEESLATTTAERREEERMIEARFPPNVQIPFTDSSIRIPEYLQRPTPPLWLGVTRGFLEAQATGRETRIQAARAARGRELAALGLEGEEFRRAFNIQTTQRGLFGVTLFEAVISGGASGEIIGTARQAAIPITTEVTGRFGGFLAGTRRGFRTIGVAAGVETFALDIAQQRLAPQERLDLGRAAIEGGLGFAFGGVLGAGILGTQAIGTTTGRGASTVIAGIGQVSDLPSEIAGDITRTGLRRLGVIRRDEPTFSLIGTPSSGKRVFGRTRGTERTRTVTPSARERFGRTTTPTTTREPTARTRTPTRSPVRVLSLTPTITRTPTRTTSLTPTLTPTLTPSITRTPTRTTTPTVTRTRTVTTPFPFLGAPFRARGRRRGRAAPIGGRVFGFAPSIASIELGITAPSATTPIGGFTGFELRPVITTNRRRRL